MRACDINYTVERVSTFNASFDAKTKKKKNLQEINFLTTVHIRLVMSVISEAICSLSSCPGSSVLLVTSLTAALKSRNLCRSSSMMVASVFCGEVVKIIDASSWFLRL